jgi:hypothetical protein
MELKPYVSTKIAYLLSTCNKFSNSFMSNMIRQYEETKTVACRHHFSFHIILHEKIDSKTNLSAFEVKSTSFDFLNRKSLSQIIQKHNNDILTDNEMKQIYYLYKKKLIDTSDMTGVYAVASLLKLYQNQYKNIFISVILDYGRDHKSVHQCAIIVDTNGILMFYEPYGKYQKYNKSYAKCVKDFLTVFTPVLGPKFFNANELNYKTFHQHIQISDNGIQQIILNANNSNKAAFDIEYKKLVHEINTEFPNCYINTLLDQNDYTKEVVDLLHGMDRHSIDNKKDKYKELLNKVLHCYYKYNSKTCVSITIVELNEYFKLVQSKIPISNMKNYYSRFTGDVPNIELMNQIYSMLSVFHNRELIEKIILDNVNSFQSCKLF